MSPAQENALRSVARRCRAAIKSDTEGKTAAEKDRITTLLLDQFTKQINALPPGKFRPRDWLAYYVRVVDKELLK
ncbi:hypothetical protein GCM10027361_00430 [Erwinia aphidicola]|uniref:hypothetical protein n=1 Tax=Erwinia aphidicola TaxID=68334 RepID=UPI001746DF24|nr:hypothetical protein [Erwinia aphidicola]MBD1377238.1 hypothetical protein [Erwinia aphidicola]